MRSSSRLFATVKSASKYLEANTPTGLTGLSTHPAPRPALIYTYRKTLSKLTQLPTSSVYRQSTEALTKQRLQIVEEAVPEGFEEWAARVKKQIEASPAAYGKMVDSDGAFTYEGSGLAKTIPWDGEVKRRDARQEGVNDMKAADKKAEAVQKEFDEQDRVDQHGELPSIDDLEQEPPLSRDQINSIESKIAAGLIEEVITVAEGELTLVEEMLKHQPWEELEEQTPTGQWKYFERGDTV